MLPDPHRGIWWSVERDGDRLLVSHGRTVDERPLPPAAIIGVSPDAALELAIDLVNACLDIDSEATTARMLALWIREQDG
jgi:hypothetical protein